MIVNTEIQQEVMKEFEQFRAPGYEDSGKPPDDWEVIVVENTQEPLEKLAELVRANEKNMPIDIDYERMGITMPILGILFVVQQLNSSGVDYSSTWSNLMILKEDISERRLK